MLPLKVQGWNIGVQNGKELMRFSFLLKTILLNISVLKILNLALRP